MATNLSEEEIEGIKAREKIRAEAEIENMPVIEKRRFEIQDELIAEKVAIKRLSNAYSKIKAFSKSVAYKTVDPDDPEGVYIKLDPDGKFEDINMKLIRDLYRFHELCKECEFKKIFMQSFIGPVYDKHLSDLEATVEKMFNFVQESTALKDVMKVNVLEKLLEDVEPKEMLPIIEKYQDIITIFPEACEILKEEEMPKTPFLEQKRVDINKGLTNMKNEYVNYVENIKKIKNLSHHDENMKQPINGYS